MQIYRGKGSLEPGRRRAHDARRARCRPPPRRTIGMAAANTIAHTGRKLGFNYMLYLIP